MLGRSSVSRVGARHWVALWSAIVAALLLAGCGSGGAGDNKRPETGSQVSKIDIGKVTGKIIDVLNISTLLTLSSSAI